jgi:hypothetical protein
MALTRNFIETIKARADRDPDFRKELLREGVETFLSGDAETGKAILRDYINATVGFGTLGKAIDIDPKSLMRMLGPSGNPKTDNLVEIIKYLQTREGVHLKVEAAAIVSCRLSAARIVSSRCATLPNEPHPALKRPGLGGPTFALHIRAPIGSLPIQSFGGIRPQRHAILGVRRRSETVRWFLSRCARFCGFVHRVNDGWIYFRIACSLQ